VIFTDERHFGEIAGELQRQINYDCYFPVWVTPRYEATEVRFVNPIRYIPVNFPEDSDQNFATSLRMGKDDNQAGSTLVMK
jgi:hypothetical protein